MLSCLKKQLRSICTVLFKSLANSSVFHRFEVQNRVLPCWVGILTGILFISFPTLAAAWKRQSLEEPLAPGGVDLNLSQTSLPLDDLGKSMSVHNLLNPRIWNEWSRELEQMFQLGESGYGSGEGRYFFRLATCLHCVTMFWVPSVANLTVLRENTWTFLHCCRLKIHLDFSLFHHFKRTTNYIKRGRGWYWQTLADCCPVWTLSWLLQPLESQGILKCTNNATQLNCKFV